MLSTLRWRMNPVTPISFLDHIIRRLGLNTHLHWEFLRRSECLLLSAVAGEQKPIIINLVFPRIPLTIILSDLFDNNKTTKKQKLLLLIITIITHMRFVHDLYRFKICAVSAICVGHCNNASRYTSDRACGFHGLPKPASGCSQSQQGECYLSFINGFFVLTSILVMG